MNRGAAVLLLIIAAGSPAVGQVTTAQYDNARTGADIHEQRLTPAVVNKEHFGKLFSLSVDGDVYAQPLVLAHVPIPGKGTHDVVYVATEDDDVYAFDASHGGEPLWRVALATGGATPVPGSDVMCPFIRPNIGISATPVIDTVSGTLFVLVRTKESGNYVHRLHALDVRTGAARHPAVAIAAPGFDLLHENPRSALLLSRGRVYLSWGSSCDVSPYHGFVMAFDARTLERLAVFNVTPTGQMGAVWQGHAGIAADSAGQVFVATANGSYDADKPGGSNYSNSVVRLSPSLQVQDFFTPFNQQELNDQDNDLGGGGPVLLPDRPGHRRLAVVGGKGGGLYVLNRESLGHFHAGDNRHAIQVIPTAGSVFGAPATWNGRVYLWGSDDVLRSFAIVGDSLREIGQGKVQFIDPGSTPTVSAEGDRNGIVWAITSKGWRSPDRPAVLYAFDAANVANELYDSEQNAERDRPGNALRFSIPTVALGRVYVGVKSGVAVYGQLR